MLCPKNFVGYSFIIKGKVGRGKEGLLCLSGVDIMFSSLTLSRLNRGVFLSLRGQVRSTYCFYVCREHVLGVTNLLSSLGTMYVSCHHCFIVLGHILCFCCVVLFLSKPAWFCG